MFGESIKTNHKKPNKEKNRWIKVDRLRPRILDR